MKNTISDKNFRKISPLQVKWLEENYHKMTSKACAEHLGINLNTLNNYAFILALKKSKAHISNLRKIQAKNTNAKRWKR